jgi:hypothetical protein
LLSHRAPPPPPPPPPPLPPLPPPPPPSPLTADDSAGAPTSAPTVPTAAAAAAPCCAAYAAGVVSDSGAAMRPRVLRVLGSHDVSSACAATPRRGLLPAVPVAVPGATAAAAAAEDGSSDAAADTPPAGVGTSKVPKAPPIGGLIATGSSGVMRSSPNSEPTSWPEYSARLSRGDGAAPAPRPAAHKATRRDDNAQRNTSSRKGSPSAGLACYTDAAMESTRWCRYTPRHTATCTCRCNAACDTLTARPL